MKSMAFDIFLFSQCSFLPSLCFSVSGWFFPFFLLALCRTLSVVLVDTMTIATVCPWGRFLLWFSHRHRRMFMVFMFPRTISPLVSSLHDVHGVHVPEDHLSSRFLIAWCSCSRGPFLLSIPHRMMFMVFISSRFCPCADINIVLLLYSTWCAYIGHVHICLYTVYHHSPCGTVSLVYQSWNPVWVKKMSCHLKNKLFVFFCAFTTLRIGCLWGSGGTVLPLLVRI